MAIWWIPNPTVGQTGQRGYGCHVSRKSVGDEALGDALLSNATFNNYSDLGPQKG